MHECIPFPFRASATAFVFAETPAAQVTWCGAQKRSAWVQLPPGKCCGFCGMAVISHLIHGHRQQVRLASVQVKINEDPAAALIRELQEELAKMKQQVLSGDMESLQVQLGGQGTGDVMANVATHTAEVQEALAKLEELQAKEEVAEEEREAKWTAERERVENAHAEQIAQLREQQRELAEQKVALEVEHQRLEAGLEDQKRGLFLDKLRHGAQIESAKKKGEETAEQAKKLKRINIANRCPPLFLIGDGDADADGDADGDVDTDGDGIGDADMEAEKLSDGDGDGGAEVEGDLTAGVLGRLCVLLCCSATACL